MGVGATTGELPEATAKDLIRKYADILRVGRLWVNHELVTWRTGCGPEDQLRGFCRGVFGVLSRQAGDDPDPQVFYGVAYWFCKAVSINYAFVDLLKTLQRKLGGPCTINSAEGQDQPSVEYSVQLRTHTARFPMDDYSDPSYTLHVSVDWKDRDNIIVVDPTTGSRQAKGTLYRMETEFPMPPRRGFAPTYTVHLDYNKTFMENLTERLWESVVCKQARCKGLDGGPDPQAGMATMLLEPRRPLLEEVDDAGCSQQ